MKLTCPQCGDEMNTAGSMKCSHCGLDVKVVLTNVEERGGPLSNVAAQLQEVI